MSIPAAFLDQLRERTTLSTLIMKTVPLKRSGREWKACCPVHQEKSPSFYVNDEKGFAHCFGCSAHFDAIRWMTDLQGMTFIDAVKELAATAGMDVPEADPRQIERDRARDGNLEIMERAAQRFQHYLAGHREGLAAGYLAKRLSLSEIQKFGIGFAPKVRLGEKPFIAEVSDDIERLISLGLMGRAETGRLYDFFRDRITIPIHDARGRVIGFGGRIVGAGEPKYLNSPDTPIFDKGRTLFNLHRAAPAARAKDRLIIVEGYFDVIGLASVGIDEVVAPNGTAFTEHQLALAWKLVDRPIMCLDGDKAGLKAAMRAALKALPLLVPGKGLDFVFPPDGLDPDDIARQRGAEAVSAMLSDRMSLIDVIWREALERLRSAKGDTSGVSAVRKDLRDMMATIKDEDVRAAFATDIQQRMAAFQARARTLPGRTATPRQAVNEAVQDALIKGIIRHVGHLGDLAEAVAMVRWTRADVGRIVDTLMWQVGESGPISDETLPEVMERRGLGGDYRTIMARETLRFPFLVGPPTRETLIELQKAIRAQGA